ncbi:MAG: CehA/McbA family metallohydrolase [Phycisphaerales bacterium]|nr:CehA/McbA family metallohydrolase [Phycisphaerales bacterium]
MTIAAIATMSAGLLSVPRTAVAHDQTPAWTDARFVHGGVFVRITGPDVVRRAGDVTLRAVIGNLAGSGPLTLTSVRWTDAAGRVLHDAAPNLDLPSMRADVFDWREVEDALHRAEAAGDPVAASALLARRAERLAAAGTRLRATALHLDAATLPPVGTTLDLTCTLVVEATDGRTREVRVPRAIEVAAPLPRGDRAARRLRFDVGTGVLGDVDTGVPGPDASSSSVGVGTWFAGDQHLHTRYSLDAFVLDGTTEVVTDYAAASEVIGLDWIIITDHSNVHVSWLGEDFYTPAQFAEASAQAAAYRAEHDYLVLYSEEMGLGSTGLFNLPSHMLAYPADADSMGYLPNPSSGLVFGLANCEPEQVIIDRIADAGGFGFIAHPYDAASLAFVPWNWTNGAVGWAGLEIWSDTNGVFKATDASAFAQWQALLNDIEAPFAGALAERPDFPTRFPVGLGNSDAHEPGLIGRTFTYARLGAPTRPEVAAAFAAGRCVASNGPLLYGEMAGAGIGDVALLNAVNRRLDVTLETTPEFGATGLYAIQVIVNGTVRATIPPSGGSDFAVTVSIDDLPLEPGDTHLTLRADRTDGVYRAMTNPVWFQFVGPGDLDGDGVVGPVDLGMLLGAWGDCAACVADANGDGVVDGADLSVVLANWTP